MENLIGSYELKDICLIVFAIILALKEGWSIFDWFKAKNDSGYNIRKNKENKDESIVNIEEDISNLKQNQKDIKNEIQILIDSDRDNIKSYITDKYHYFIEEGKIDDYSLDCLEKRYSHYKEEGGNSFIEDLMSEIRKLPKINIKEK